MRGLRAVHWLRDDRGTVTAEFAVALPAVILVLMLAVAALQGAALQVRVVDAAAVAARTLARGEAGGDVGGRLHQLLGEYSLGTANEGDFLCATVSAPIRFGAFGSAGFDASARSCALAGGR
ncbi:hypothetical protein B7R21_03885 [Subtercola boreus]|uniref:Pilus assembly protein TadE n=2 Tax=Subtercola boreus TaxID=120213 RepID=A0A3E0W1K4_9MICO|nr:hypothetical protein B7R21_03885 [Subtercola boreus]